MSLNKKRTLCSTDRLLVIALFSVLLVACRDQSKISRIIHSLNVASEDASVVSVDNPREAQLWLEQQANNLPNATENPLNNATQNANRGWIRVATAPASDKVFIAISAESVANFINKTKDDKLRTQEGAETVDADPFGMANGTVPVNPTVPQARTELELAQANVSQIKFLGVMRNADEQFGLIQVGERVYRVKQNEPIGAGKWRVASIDETRMRLMVNGKVVTYDK